LHLGEILTLPHKDVCGVDEPSLKYDTPWLPAMTVLFLTSGRINQLASTALGLLVTHVAHLSRSKRIQSRTYSITRLYVRKVRKHCTQSRPCWFKFFPGSPCRNARREHNWRLWERSGVGEDGLFYVVNYFLLSMPLKNDQAFLSQRGRRLLRDCTACSVRAPANEIGSISARQLTMSVSSPVQ